jgi:hypothetical protein
MRNEGPAATVARMPASGTSAPVVVPAGAPAGVEDEHARGQD